MEIINMTPHTVHIVNADGVVVREYPASGRLIRLESRTEPCGVLEDMTPLSRTVFGKPEGLPEFEPGTFYIVSQLVKSALPERERWDLLVPAEVVRDAEGNILGCRSLGR
jgi:hypothetical protein